MVQRITLAAVTATLSGTLYTEEVNTQNLDDAVVKITSSAGSITVTQQGSIDSGANWYDMEDGAGNAVGALVATMTVGTKICSGALKFAPSTRFKIVETGVAETIVNISLSMKNKI